MRHHLLLFDIDGTLLHTRGVGQRAMDNVGRRMFGESFSFDGVAFAGCLDPLIFAEAARLNRLDNHEDHHDGFRDAYLAELAAVLAEQGRNGGGAALLPGVSRLLFALTDRMHERGDVMLGLLTGNYSDAVPVKFEAVGLDPATFTITAFGDEGRTRPDLTALALAKYERHTGVPAQSERVIVIGDTPHDVDCAKAHDCVAFGVATGRYSVDDLREAGADVAVESLENAQPLLALLGG